MSQINEETNYEQKIAKYKAFIMELSEVQESYYQKLVKEINISAKDEEYLFDYIYNADFTTFEDYLAQFNKQ
jgi:hypothetical protein